MLITLVLCAMPFYILFAWLCQKVSLRFFARTPQKYFGVSLLVGLLPSLAIILWLCTVTLPGYNGVCYDSQTPCVLTEFLLDQALWAMWLAIPLLILNLPTSMLVFVFGWKPPK